MKYPIFIIFSFLFFTNAFAQKDSSGTVTVTYSRVSYPRTQKDQGIYNLIKINPLLVLNGDIPIYYERRIKDQLSVEGSIGVTHMDYIYTSTLVDETGYTDTRRAKLGYSGSLALKFYPSTYTRALDEIYFGAEVRHRRYAMELEDCGTTSQTGWLPEHRRLTDFKLIIGYISYLSDVVIVDFYGGIGMRSRDIQLAHCSYNNGMEYETTNDLVPIISAGIKIGFAF